MGVDVEVEVGVGPNTGGYAHRSFLLECHYFGIYSRCVILSDL